MIKYDISDKLTDMVEHLPCSFQKFRDVESIIKIVDIDGRAQVRDFSEDIERMLGSKMKSVKVSTKVRYKPHTR